MNLINNQDHLYNLLTSGIANQMQDTPNSSALSRALTKELPQYALPEEIPPGIFVGYDPAKDRDRSAVVILEQGFGSIENPCPKLRLRAKRNMKGMKFGDQRTQIVALDRLHTFTSIAMDTTRHEDTFENLHDHFGPRIVPVKFTKPIKATMLTNMLKLFQDDILELDPTHAYHELLRKELYELDPNTLKHPQTSSGSDDFVWALALAVASIVQRDRDNVESGFSNDQLMF